MMTRSYPHFPCPSLCEAQPGLIRRFERQLGRGEGALGHSASALPAQHNGEPGRREGDAARSQRGLQLREPSRVALAAFQETGPLAQRMLIGIAARRMLRVEAIDQAVEKAPPAGGALAEQDRKSTRMNSSH